MIKLIELERVYNQKCGEERKETRMRSGSPPASSSERADGMGGAGGWAAAHAPVRWGKDVSASSRYSVILTQLLLCSMINCC